MKEFIDKLISRLENHAFFLTFNFEAEKYLKFDKTISIITELAEEYNKKQEHEVWLNGCDDDTIFTMEMTNSEYEFLKRVSELANETSGYYCMPRLYLDEGVGYTPSYTEGE